MPRFPGIPIAFAALALLAAAPAHGEDILPNPEWTAEGGFAALSVADLDGAVAWYRDMLGFSVLAAGERPEQAMRFALLSRGRNLIEILARQNPEGVGDTPDRSMRQGIFKLGFWVADLDALAEALETRGAAFNHGIVGQPGQGYRTFAVRDSEGNTLQFFGE